MRAKVLPQDPIYLPEQGIKLLRDDVIYRPVGSAGFRIETLQFEKIMTDLKKWLRTMPTHTR